MDDYLFKGEQNIQLLNDKIQKMLDKIKNEWNKQMNYKEAGKIEEKGREGGKEREREVTVNEKWYLLWKIFS